MSLEIFRMNENGTEWVSLENATISEKLDLEWALMNNAKMQMLCYVCHVEISHGNTCAKHMPALNTCKVCEYAHEGLYCTNCFTGERVRIGKTRFARVMQLTPVNA